MTCQDFNKANAHCRDSEIEFEADSHTYRFHGRELKSVTTLIEEQFPKFDADFWSERVAAREGLTAIEVKARWEAEGAKSRRLGTAMHERIEHYYINGGDDGEDTDVFGLFRAFSACVRLHPYRTEWRIYDEDFDIAGTLDFLELTPDGVFNIWDWKRSSKLVTPEGGLILRNKMGKTGFHPVCHLPDTPYYHYALQLSIYRFILERKYGIKVTGLNLGVFHPAHHCPWSIAMPYLETEARWILSSHKNVGIPRTR